MVILRHGIRGWELRTEEAERFKESPIEIECDGGGRGRGLNRKSSKKNRKWGQMKAKVVMLPLSVNFEKTSASGEKTARQA